MRSRSESAAMGIISVMLVGLLAACGSGDGTTGDSPAAGTPEVSSPTVTASANSLKDTCPLVEAALPSGMVPPSSKFEAARVEIRGLSDSGDVETQNALDGLLRALAAMRDASPGGEYVDASQKLIAALQDLGIRCKAVGSSALQ
jgi:hypothetical protein